MFEQVLERLRPRQTQLSLPEGWRSLSENFQAVWIADGSTLEELRRKLKALRDKPDTVLGGKMMMVVEAFSHRPVASWYTDDSKANDKTFADNLLECLPQQGLLIFDLGFFKFLKTKAKLLGVVKARRKRHRDLDAHTQLIWSCPFLS